MAQHFAAEISVRIDNPPAEGRVALFDSAYTFSDLSDEVKASPIVSEGYVIKGFVAINYVF